MSARRIARSPLVTIVVAAGVLLAVAGCAARIGPGSTSWTTSDPPPSAPGTPLPSTDTGPTGPVPTADRPPDAVLAAEGGDPVIGQLGTYTWGDGGSDSPWLPGAPIAVGAGEALTVRVEGDVPIRSWAARLAPADDASGARARPIGEGGAAIGFVAPGPGAWTVAITVHFRDGESATYAWRLDVD